MVEVYTRKSCQYCSTFKSTLDKFKISYKEHVIDEDITKERVVEMFPWCVTLPVVVVNGEPLTLWQANKKLEEMREDFGKQLLNE